MKKIKLNSQKRCSKKQKNSGKEILLPSDVVIADKFDNSANTKVIAFDKMTEEIKEWMGMDIGPDTISKVSEK